MDYGILTTKMSQKTWLMKTEPTTYSITDLRRDGVTPWEGIRNYQARNMMMNDMSVGDQVFIYHSNSRPPGIVGMGVVASAPYPDHFAWDPTSPYFDSASAPSKPRWWMVDIQFKAEFSLLISLPQLKQDPHLSDMMVTQRGCRLSIQPVAQTHFRYIIETYAS